MYENLAAKYRPNTLSDLMGQDAVKTTLSNAVKLNRVAHSYVFYGPRGCGKTTVARILAKTLNCHNPDKNGNPCGKCASCTEIAESKSLDVIEIDAASNTAVDNVRSVILDQVNFAPSRDKYKVYILDEVHMLSKGSFNALLKTLEEPPAHVVFIMATTEQDKVLSTILSRSQCFRFKFIPETEITERLKYVAAQEKISIDSESLRLITKACGGAMRDALTLLDRAASFCGNEIKVSVLNELLGRPNEELLQLLALSLINRDAAALHSSFDRIISDGYDVLTTLREVRNLISEAFFTKMGYSDTGKEPIRALPSQITTAALAKLSRKLTGVIKEVQYSDVLPVAAEIALFTLIDVPQDLSGLLSRLEALEKRLKETEVCDYENAGSVKKKDELKYSANEASLVLPVAEIPVKNSESKKISSAVFASAWRKTLGKISASRPFLYNELAECKLRHDGGVSVTLVAKNLFYANRVSFALAELSELMSAELGAKLDFVVTSGEEAMKSAVQIEMPKNPENIASAQDSSASSEKEDNTGIEEEPLPDTGEAAEITDTEESPPENNALIKNEALEPADKLKAEKKVKAGIVEKNKAIKKENIQPKTEHMSKAQSSYAGKAADYKNAALSAKKHEAAKLEYVPEEKIPAELQKIKAVFGEDITRVNKVL